MDVEVGAGEGGFSRDLLVVQDLFGIMHHLTSWQRALLRDIALSMRVETPLSNNNNTRTCTSTSTSTTATPPSHQPRTTPPPPCVNAPSGNRDVPSLCRPVVGAPVVPVSGVDGVVSGNVAWSDVVCRSVRQDGGGCASPARRVGNQQPSTSHRAGDDGAQVEDWFQRPGRSRKPKNSQQQVPSHHRSAPAGQSGQHQGGSQEQGATQHQRLGTVCLRIKHTRGPTTTTATPTVRDTIPIHGSLVDVRLERDPPPEDPSARPLTETVCRVNSLAPANGPPLLRVQPCARECPPVTFITNDIVYNKTGLLFKDQLARGRTMMAAACALDGREVATLRSFGSKLVRRLAVELPSQTATAFLLSMHRGSQALLVVVPSPRVSFVDGVAVPPLLHVPLPQQQPPPPVCLSPPLSVSSHAPSSQEGHENHSAGTSTNVTTPTNTVEVIPPPTAPHQSPHVSPRIVSSRIVSPCVSRSPSPCVGLPCTYTKERRGSLTRTLEGPSPCRTPSPPIQRPSAVQSRMDELRLRIAQLSSPPPSPTVEQEPESPSSSSAAASSSSSAPQEVAVTPPESPTTVSGRPESPSTSGVESELSSPAASASGNPLSTEFWGCRDRARAESQERKERSRRESAVKDLANHLAEEANKNLARTGLPVPPGMTTEEMAWVIASTRIPPVTRSKTAQRADVSFPWKDSAPHPVSGLLYVGGSWPRQGSLWCEQLVVKVVGFWCSWSVALSSLPGCREIVALAEGLVF